MAGNSNASPAQDAKVLATQTQTDTTEAGVTDPLAAEKELDKGAAANVVTPDNLDEILANIRAAGLSIRDTNFAYMDTNWADYAPSPAYQQKVKDVDGFEAKVKQMVEKASKLPEYKNLKLEQVFDANAETNRLVLKSGKRIQL